MSRPQVIRILAALVALTAVGAVVVGTAGRSTEDDVATLRSGADPREVIDELLPMDTAPVEETTTTLEATSTTLASPPPTAASATSTPTSSTPSTTAAPPTTVAAATPAAALDPGEPVCSPPPDGGLIRGAVVGVSMADGIHELSLDGRRDVLVPGSAAGGTPTPAAWSADGRRLAFIRPSDSRQDRNRYAARDLYTVDLERSCSRLLTRSGSDSYESASWSPDGSRLSYTRRASSMWSDPAALETARADGSDVRRLASSPRLLGATWAPDGSGRLAFGQDGGLRVLDLTGRTTVVDDTAGGAEFQSWSPDSTQLVYTVSVNQGIWIARADGSGVRNLAPSGSRQPVGIFWSRWSPDGRSIVYAQGRELWVVGVDGSERRRVAEDVDFNGGWFTPDGAGVVYNADGDVLVAPIDGSTAPRLLKANATVLEVFRRS